VKELILLFTRLGFTAFGGPAAHIGMMQDEVVEKRSWMSRQHFLDLVGATNLIPGPNSTEMVMHIGFERAGWRGMFAAGSSFILPAALTTGLLGWFYVRYGDLPKLEPYLAGIQAAVLAIILAAVWRLALKAVKGWRLLVIGGVALAAVLLGYDPVLVLFACGVLGALWLRFSGEGAVAGVALLPIASQGSIAAGAGASVGGAAGAAATGSVSLVKLGLLFLKIGAILYGSGYVLIAFLQRSVVEQYGWITNQQLLDVVALGQLTPGPVLATATVIGYMTAGLLGAVVATVGIFLPSFLFVSLLNPVIPRLRRSPWAAAFLDAVNVTAVGLMAAVLVDLGRGALEDWLGRVIFAVAAIAILRFKVATAWIVLGAAVAGGIAQQAGG
jgi:chromate transporter